MEIAINAKVFCADGECGHVSCVIVHPIHKEVTHIVVLESVLLDLNGWCRYLMRQKVHQRKLY